MKIYRVGGAVRDKLLNLPIHEKDWVVVGSTPDEMIKLGFRPVGKDFPVFLHPQSHEEYALARTERKTGKGYTQFSFHASPEVTLEEDLKRRDLTINAIAVVEETGEIIDPYNGQQDIKNKLLRHISEAFIEDPVRILRVARFLARFYSLGFKIAPETKKLIKFMVQNGEVDALVPDRVWQELDRALGEKNPEKFFEVLIQCGAFEKLFDNLMNINFQINPAYKKAIIFSHLFLDKPVENVQKFCKKYPVPNYYKELAELAHKTQKLFTREVLTAEEKVNILEKTDAYRRPERFEDLLIIFEKTTQSLLLKKAFELSKAINIQNLQEQGLEGKALGQAIHQERIKKLLGESNV